MTSIGEALGWIVGAFVYGILVALFATGIAFWLGTASNPPPARKQAALGGAIASSVLCLVPIAALAIMEPWSAETLLVLVVMLVAAAFMAAVFGFPPAYYLARRREDKRVGKIRQAE